jgi:acetoacetyl-CoA synthetase
VSAPLWRPDAARVAGANITAFARAAGAEWGRALPDYDALYRWSVAHPEEFWRSLWRFGGVIASDQADRVVADPDRMPGARWFPGARFNFAENLLRDRVEGAAIVFRAETGSTRTVGWRELRGSVSRLAQALRAAGIGPGDRVAAFVPNLPEAITAMLATTSIGAVWSSCSPDFGASGVLDRFGQIRPKLLFTADGYHYNGRRFDSLPTAAAVARGLPDLERVVVLPYLEAEPAIPAELPRGTTLAEFVAPHAETAIAFEQLPFDHPLYILFSSGTTGVPKCIVHGAGGTLLQHLKEQLLHVDLKPAERLFFFTTCGWMMWNWLASGLACGATLLLYDGSPFHPNGEALFDFADQAGMTVFGTSAKFIDAVHKAGLRPRDTHRLDTVRTILSTGSPLAPESFDFVYRAIKEDVCLSSMSGGTDIVSCFVLGNPTLPVWRGEIQCRGLGMKVEVYDDAGRAVAGEKGELVCTAPFPSMPIGFWNDPDGAKYRAAYFERFPGVWCHGDYVALTEHGGLIIYGRSDAVLNPGGVRIGTAEIYRQVEAVEEVLESLVVGQDWEGDVRVVLFVVLRAGTTLDDDLIAKIKRRIRTGASPRHVPAKILQVADIPRTRSGKIVELAVRDVIHGRPVKNTEALANPEALDLYRGLAELRT